MSHNCQEAQGQLYHYLDAELDESTAASLRSHLDECTGCLGSFEFERRLKNVISDHLKEDMPESLVTKVQRLINEESQ